MNVLFYTDVLSAVTLCSHIFLAVFFLLRFLPFSFTRRAFFGARALLGKHGLLFALTVSACSTFGPLIYTHLYYLTPCILCWYQRVFMFPLFVLLLIAYFRNDFSVKAYAYALGALGACIAVFHYVSQQLQSHFSINTVGCDAIGMAKSCTEYYFIEFGYITIPMMSLTSFVLILFFTYFARRA